MTIEPKQTAFPPRTSIKDLVAQRILDRSDRDGEIITSQAEFEAWLTQGWGGGDRTRGKGDVRDQATAKTMLATWIEERLRAQDGVWFGPSDTHFTLGLKGRGTIPVQVPSWITSYIGSFPPSRGDVS